MTGGIWDSNISPKLDGLRRQGRGTPPRHPTSILLCSGDLLEALTVRSPCWRHARASCGRGAGRDLPHNAISFILLTYLPYVRIFFIFVILLSDNLTQIDLASRVSNIFSKILMLRKL